MGRDCDAFISYTRQQGARVANRVLDLLKTEHGFKIWQDRSHMRGGDDFWRQIREAIERANYLIMVLTPDAFEGDRRVLRDEWLTARRAGCRVLPVQERAAIRFSDPAVPVPTWLRKLDCYDLEDANHCAKLVNDLRTTPEQKPVPHNVEFPARFVPRKLEMDQVVSILTRGVESDRTATVAALIGAGGFGKTSLAKAICYDDDILARYTDGVLWLTIGEGTRSIAELLTSLLNQLGETASATDADTLFGRWKEALRTRQCLVVLDDVWREAEARSLVMRETSSAFLITTRIPRVVSAVEAAECNVGEMSLVQATSVLHAALDDAEVHDTRLTGLAERAGYWPLLLGLIGGQLRHKVGRPGATSITALDEVEEDLEEQGLTAFDRNDPSERSAAVRTTIDASLRFLKAIDSNAPRLYAELAVFPEDEPIPLPVLQDLWKTSRPETRRTTERFDDAGLAVFHRERGIMVHDVFLKNICTRWQPGEIQALHRRLIESWPDVYNLPYDYAQRWFGWHCVQACESERLAKLLFDLKWLFAHLRGSGATSLIVDVGRAANALPSLKHSLDLLKEALEKSAHVLVRAPEQFAAQLFGRLRPGLTAELDSLAEQCRHNLRDNPLCPIYEKLAPVGSQLKRTLLGHEEPVSGALQLSDERLLSWSSDQTLRLWSAEGAPVTELRGHEGRVSDALQLSDGRLLSWSDDCTLRLWSAEGAPVTELRGHEGWVFGALQLSDGRLASWSNDCTLRLWSAEGTPVTELRGHEGRVYGALQLSDGRLLSWSSDQTLRLWSAEGTPVTELRGHEGPVYGALQLSDGRLLSWSNDCTLRLWLAEGTPVTELRGHEKRVSGALQLSDGRLLSWSDDCTLRLWLAEGTPVTELRGHEGSVSGALQLSDGRLLSWSNDCTLRLWLAEGTPLTELRGHEKRVSGALQLSDGRLLSWSNDCTLRLWLAEGTPVTELRGHEGPVYGALQLSDGRLLSWSEDRTLRLWSHDGTLIDSLHFDASVTTAVQASDGQLFVGDSLGTVHWIKVQ